MEVIIDANMLTRNEVKQEYEECSELLAIFTSIAKKLSL